MADAHGLKAITFSRALKLVDHLGHQNSLRQKNPNTVITAYFSPADYVDDEDSIRWRKLMRTFAYGTTYDPITQVDSDPLDNFDAAQTFLED